MPADAHDAGFRIAYGANRRLVMLTMLIFASHMVRTGALLMLMMLVSHHMVRTGAC